jgi:hypothetical protein
LNSVAALLKSVRSRSPRRQARAPIPDARGTIRARADRDGRLRVIDTEAGTTCKPSETQLSWAATAPPAPPPEPEAKPPSPRTVGHPGESESITLLVNKELTEAGSVRPACSAEGNAMGAQVGEVVIRAVEVGTITTDPGPPPLP